MLPKQKHVLLKEGWWLGFFWSPRHLHLHQQTRRYPSPAHYVENLSLPCNRFTDDVKCFHIMVLIPPCLRHGVLRLKNAEASAWPFGFIYRRCKAEWMQLSWLGLYFGRVITRFLQGEKRSKCISYHYYHWKMKRRSLAHKMLYYDTSSQMAKEMVSAPGHQSCYHMDEILRHITDDLLSWSTDWIFIVLAELLNFYILYRKNTLNQVLS